jgi:predicted deacetylase
MINFTKSKYILRFDDITPHMDWSNFSIFDQVIKSCKFSPLLGIVPDCRDPNLLIHPPREDFWDVVREWSRLGWTIAQHGYTHQYVTSNAGLLGINKRSEFSGISYTEQLAKLKAGKEVLMQQDVWQPVFMAPAHSFDGNTICALANLDFQYFTDGYGTYPYRMGELTAVPQLFASPINFGFGVYTVCLHVNQMTPSQISSMVNFITAHRKQFISFEEAVEMQCPIPGAAAASRLFTAVALRTIRSFR